MNRENVKTLQDLIRQSAADYGDKVFLKEKAENNTIAEFSFAQFYADSLRIAAFLQTQQEQPNTPLHAAVIGPTSYAYLISYFGTV
ncbi:MAG: hypothetical protein ACI4TG_00875, partial [Ruminococcus sp.]